MKENENEYDVNTERVEIKEILIEKKEEEKEEKSNLEQDIYAVFINNPLLNTQ